jgi:hypothetical protein
MQTSWLIKLCGPYQLLIHLRAALYFEGRCLHLSSLSEDGTQLHSVVSGSN